VALTDCLAEGEVEGCALPDLGFGPYLAAMFVNDLLDGCQADACAFEFLLPVEPLKHSEELIGVAHIEADSVVAHKVDAGIRVQ